MKPESDFYRGVGNLFSARTGKEIALSGTSQYILKNAAIYARDFRIQDKDTVEDFFAKAYSFLLKNYRSE